VEPIGTITKYYQFVDQETEKILDRLMHESSSYYDFVHRLAGFVTERDVSEDLAFIAAEQTWQIKEKDLSEVIRKKYGHLTCIRPWCNVYGVSQFYQIDLQKKIKDDLDTLIRTSPKDWMIVDLLIWNAHDVYSQMDANQKITIAKDIINKNPNLNCFEYTLYSAEGLMKWQEGKPTEAIDLWHQARDYASSQNDILSEYYNILNMANYTKSVDCRKSFDLFEEAYQIALDLQVPFLIADLLSDYSLAYEVSGEYDLALSSQFEGQGIYNKGGMELPYGITSRIYAEMGNGQASLEWANKAIELNPSFNLLHLRKAQALILLNRLDEAEEVLGTACKLSLQTGHDRDISRYNLALGQFEMAKGNLLSAKECLEQAYEISSRMRDGTTLNEVMVSLAKLELSQFKQSKTGTVAGPGKWMTALEHLAKTQDLPGIAMQVAIFKSELFQSQGQLKDALETLQRSLEISDSPGVKTLRQRIATKIQELEQLIVDEELAS